MAREKRENVLRCRWKTPLSQGIRVAGSQSLSFFMRKLLRVVTSMLSSSLVEVFPCSINLEVKLCQIKTISRKCLEMHWGMALTMNAEGTPFYI